MTSSQNSKAASLRSCLLTAAGLALLVSSGCSSGAKPNVGEARSASDGGSAHLDAMCIGERIEKPPESFHYFFKSTDASGSVAREADITPQTMDITTTDNSGSHSYHGVRSDENSWNRAMLSLSSLSITAMAARLDSLNGTSAITAQGAEAMNGYQTTKYSFDSTSGKSSDQKQFETLFGPGSFDKGTIWMGQDGCAVKLLLDEGIWQTNGSIQKRHYEMARSKK